MGYFKGDLGFCLERRAAILAPLHPVSGEAQFAHLSVARAVTSEVISAEVDIALRCRSVEFFVKLLAQLENACFEQIHQVNAEEIDLGLVSGSKALHVVYLAKRVDGETRFQSKDMVQPSLCSFTLQLQLIFVLLKEV